MFDDQSGCGVTPAATFDRRAASDSKVRQVETLVCFCHKLIVLIGRGSLPCQDPWRRHSECEEW